MHSTHAHIHPIFLPYFADVNPKFDSLTSFESTPGLEVFDTLGLKLVHGWVVDPGSPHAKALRGLSYFEVNTTVVIHNSQAQRDDDAVATVDRIRTMEDFLARSSHQLTPTGLNQLRTLTDDEFYVFYRNSHFAVLTKHKGKLYALITDFGYVDVDVVWEQLTTVNDSVLCNAKFKPTQAAHHHREVALQMGVGEETHDGAAVSGEDGSGLDTDDGEDSVSPPPARRVRHKKQDERKKPAQEKKTKRNVCGPGAKATEGPKKKRQLSMNRQERYRRMKRITAKSSPLVLASSKKR